MGETVQQQLRSNESRCLAWLAADCGLTLFQKILLSTDGTVTDLLALYCGLPIQTFKVEQSLQAGGPDALGVGAHVPVLHRSVILGSDAVTPYLHAHSHFVVDRLSAATRRDLLETDLPIGLLWRRERLEMYREIIACKRVTDARIAGLLHVAPETNLLARTYRIVHGARVMGMITETFAATVLH